MKSFIKTIASSLNPNIYGGLVSRSYQRTASHFFMLMFFFSLFTFIIFTPQIIGFYKNFNSNIEKLSSLNLEFNAETKDEISILSNPKIIIDSTRNSTNGEYLLITKDKIYKKGLFGYKEYSNKADLAVIAKQSKLQITIFLLIFLPTIFLFHYLLNSIKYFLLAMIASLISLIIIKLTNSTIKIKQIINASMYSLTLIIILKIALYFNQTFRLYIPIMVYIIWYILVLILLQDTKIEYTKNKTTPKKSKTSNRNPDANEEEIEKIQKLVNR